MAATEAVSRWMQLIAHQAALVVSFARATANSVSSVNTPTGHDASTQRHRRTRQTSST